MKKICKIVYMLVAVTAVVGLIPCFGWLNGFAITLASIGLTIALSSLVSVVSIQEVISNKCIESDESMKELKSTAITCLVICIVALLWCPWRWALGGFII